MAAAVPLFSNYNITQTIADAGRVISFSQDWIGVIISVSSVTGTNPGCELKIQWSNDGATWFDPPAKDLIALVTVPGQYILRASIKAPYWRTAATVTGMAPVFTASGAALV